MNLLIAGAGKIGTAIAHLFQSCGEYQVTLIDHVNACNANEKIKYIHCDIRDMSALDQLFTSHTFHAVISSLPYFCNIAIAEKARQHHLHYFDLTEDVKITEMIAKIAQNSDTVFIPHCGIAPGFINIVAYHLMQSFDTVDSVLLRAGALPQHSHNTLHYALTWSTDGLINEYGNLCEAIVDGKKTLVSPLENIEEIILDGIVFEAFNTSGGLGSLSDSCAGKVRNLNYKTLRYPGHCEKIKFLMNDLNFNHHRDILKSILEESIPTTHEDSVIIYVSVSGRQGNQFIEKNYTKKLYPATVNQQWLTAIQLSTASSICAVVDMILTKQYVLKGFVTQEKFKFEDVINNRFGQYYA